ncbi:hypothetical protein ODJ79_14590 [Actinoplanes sp. KI2]|uniref:hypothetical protein n=1 Tax=Actinoplanes sp. KI2 TaxID=2983315 RepID=UPI0021D5CA46|nr:hypothetical protein [Actinoplanes sp. KI2]MCU7724952.1 hypothetical protein [Actinoplanes sp. KI2]
MVAFTGPASASGRPCSPGFSTIGVGSQGSPYILKAKQDDDEPGGSPVVGEEFEIKVPAGQVWQVTFADNGVIFFDQPSTSTVDGIREVHAAPSQPGTQHMTVHSVSRATGEVIDAFVDVPAAPNCGGH